MIRTPAGVPERRDTSRASDQFPIMASTYLALHYHIVFGTKDRMPLISASWRARLHEYLGGTVHGLGGMPEAIGGVADHVHLLVELKSTHCLADFVRELKKASSAWVHETIESSDKFAWQNGYAAFTVSATSRNAVREYIRNQEEHHRAKSFREECIAMLDKAGIAYDPKFLD
jgi:REP element-mobilizing transposase RayT